MKNVPTWCWEQVVLVLLLTPGMLLTAQQDPSLRGVLRVVVAFVGAMATQKARSGANRRREQDELRGIRASELRCAKAITMWSTVGQVTAVLGLFVSSPTSRWSYLAAAGPTLYALSYDLLWRPYYRRHRPARPE